MDKYLFVTGGVLAGLGKGITTSSIGLLLKPRGISVTAIKMCQTDVAGDGDEHGIHAKFTPCRLYAQYALLLQEAKSVISARTSGITWSFQVHRACAI
jgi:hypothetical protein